MLCGHILLIEVIAMRELRFTLANVPGTLAEVTTVLGKGNVNIDGIVGVPGGSLVCLVVDDTGRARGVLQRLGLTFQEREAVALDLPDRPGELGKLLERVASGGINLDSLYPAVVANRVLLTGDGIAALDLE